jgi:hypothetical protein
LFLSKTQIHSAQTLFNKDASKVAFLRTTEHSYPLPQFECEIAKISDIQGTRRSLSINNKTLTDVQVFLWNPTKNASDFVFVYNNDIYYQKSYDRPESVIRVTHSDSPYIHHGIGDWMIRG